MVACDQDDGIHNLEIFDKIHQEFKFSEQHKSGEPVTRAGTQEIYIGGASI